MRRRKRWESFYLSEVGSYSSPELVCVSYSEGEGTSVTLVLTLFTGLPRCLSRSRSYKGDNSLSEHQSSTRGDLL
jgi:hypothetical protein